LALSAAAIVEPFGIIDLNQTQQTFTTGINGSRVPVATVFTVAASDLATANQVPPPPSGHFSLLCG
jgi:hypothetical protein